jgi:hypothetical protein
MSMSPVSHNAWFVAPRARRALLSAIAVSFTLATVDLIFACTFWHQMYALPVARLLQNIASGMLGKRAFAGGADTVIMGLLLQYIMMFMMVGTYYLFSRRFTGLCRHPWRYGSLYGVVLYIVMNDVVLPLSAAPKTPFLMSWILSSMVMHWVIGVVTAHGASRA